MVYYCTTIHDPRRHIYKYKQEGCTFGIMQLQFAIIGGLIHFSNKHLLDDIINACIIIHNMIINDERDGNTPIEYWMKLSN